MGGGGRWGGGVDDEKNKEGSGNISEHPEGLLQVRLVQAGC